MEEVDQFMAECRRMVSILTHYVPYINLFLVKRRKSDSKVEGVPKVHSSILNGYISRTQLYFYTQFKQSNYISTKYKSSKI